jgi:hypothetical protein
MLKAEVNMKEYTTIEFEQIVGLHKRVLQRLAGQGVIGHKRGRDWYYTLADLKTIEKKGLRRGVGHPRRNV